MEVPWSSLIGLLFMTMGPIQAVAVFANVGTDDRGPGVRPMAARATALTATAFVLAVFGGTGTLAGWGVSLPVLIGSGGIVILALSLQSLLAPSRPMPPPIDPLTTRATQIVFPGLFPPIAVTIPIIFAAALPDMRTRLQIIAVGLVLILINWILMLFAKKIIRAIGTVPLEILGAVFGVLQVALGLQFIVNAVMMLIKQS